MQQLRLRAQRLNKYRDTLPADVFQEQVRYLEQACDTFLGMDVRTEIARRLQKRYVKHREHLFVFLYDPEVPNAFNGKERALRNSVVHLCPGGLPLGVGCFCLCNGDNRHRNGAKSRLPSL